MVSLHGALLRTVEVFSGLREIVPFFLEMRTTFVRMLSFVCLCDGVHYDDEGPSCRSKSSIALGVERRAFAYASLLFFHTFTKLQSESREFSLSLFLCNSVIRWYMAGYISYTQQSTRRPMITR